MMWTLDNRGTSKEESLHLNYQTFLSRSRGLIRTIWQTKEQLGPDDPVDVQIKTTLKELVTYIIFFSVLLVGEYRPNIRLTWNVCDLPQ